MKNINNTGNIIVLNNRLFDLGPERNIKMSLIESVKAIFPSRNLIKENAQTVRPQPPKPKAEEPQKSFKEILDEVKTDRDEVFISAEGRDSFKVNKDSKKDKVSNDCNHDPNSEVSSLKLLPRRTMVMPQTYDMVCSECKQNFKFAKDKDTKKYVNYNNLTNLDN